MVHPLLLPNVLKQVLEHFSPRDLKTLRQVNLDWNIAACLSISNRQIINFLKCQDLKGYRGIFKNSLFCPHGSFKFHFEISTTDFHEIEKFITEFQQYIRSLNITIGTGFLTVEQVQAILRNANKLENLSLRFHYFKCPALDVENSGVEIAPLLSLKSLQIQVYSYDTSWDCSTNLLQSIFLAAPNLNKIGHPDFYIPPTKCRIPSQMNIFLTELILRENLSKNYLSKLSYLEFIMKLNEENIRVLTSKKYPLRHLYMNLWYPDEEELCVTPASLIQLMLQLSPILINLGLDFPWRRDVAYEFKFPVKMKNLCYLSLNGFQGSLICLLEKLPSLKSLELSQVDLLEILPSSQVTSASLFSTVLKLRLDFCTNQSAGVLSRLARIFKNLTSLDVNHCTNELCRMIFKKMSALSHLRLHGDDLTDEGITGISSEVAKENKLITCSVDKGNSLRQFSFIGDLPCLKRLKLDAYQLTEACISHGIVHCVSLEFVIMDTRLENDPSSSITRTFRLSEYGRKKVDGEKEVTLLLKEQSETDEDEDAEKFFSMYEKKGMLTDLLFAYK